MEQLMRYKTTQAAALAAMMIVSGMYGGSRAAQDSDKWDVPRREASRKNPMPTDPKSLARGKALYGSNCVMCHGDGGKGDGSKARDLEPKPSDLTSRIVAEQSDGAIYWKITTGRPPMPSFGKCISSEDRWHVVNYLRALAPAGR